MDGPTLFSELLDQEKPGWTLVCDTIISDANDGKYEKIIKSMTVKN